MGAPRAEVGNRLLDALPGQELAQLHEYLESVPLTLRQPLQQPDVLPQYVYFPIDAICSVVSQMEDGTTIEALIVGCEGVTGLPQLLGARTGKLVEMAQVPGLALRLRLRDLHLQDLPHLSSGLRAYTIGVLLALVRCTACNRAHSVEQRAARWLLMVDDGVGGLAFQLTQELLAMMLGVNRPNVTLAAAALARSGLIEYRYGKVRVLNRRGLERRACECYSVIHEALHGTDLNPD